MQTLIYDGSFEGFLSAASLVLENAFEQADIVSQDRTEGLLFGGEEVTTAPDQAQSLLKRFAGLAGERNLRPVLLTFLADGEPREHILLDLFRLTFREGKNVCAWHHHDGVRRWLTTARRVSQEIHRLTGLVRFQELADGSFYAPFEPDHDIVVPLARHFSRRMPDCCWMIHDLRRGAGILWNGQTLLPAELSASQALPLASHESFFQSCWQSYHRKIALPGRKRPRLQKQFMPVRYWKYLTELS